MNFKEKYGSWALITGASSGIGAEFAKQLGMEGLNLILVARRNEKLESVAKSIQNEFDIKIKTVAVDLTTKDFLNKIRITTDNLNIGLLVNNAGLWKMGDYLDIALDDELKMIDLNIKAPAILTHHFASKMKIQKQGGIINIASMLGYLGVPYSAVYAATKAYEIVKSEGMWFELKKQNIDVLSLNPGLTKTEMITEYDFSHMPMKPSSPKLVVKTALKALGRKSQVIPGTFNKMLGVLSKRVMSRNMNTKMFGYLFGKTNSKLKTSRI